MVLACGAAQPVPVQRVLQRQGSVCARSQVGVVLLLCGVYVLCVCLFVCLFACLFVFVCVLPIRRIAARVCHFLSMFPAIFSS